VRFDPDAESAIASHPWPGNLRELRFAVERAVLLSPKEQAALPAASLALHEATPGAAPPLPVSPGVTHVATQPGGVVSVTFPPGGGATLEQIETAVLRAALNANGGNVVHAARSLGISRDTLRYRMKKFDRETSDG